MFREKKPDRQAVADKLAAIEAEMKRIGAWQTEPLPAEKYDFHQGFAIDTMAFTQWLQFIFIPRVREIIASGGEFPKESYVSAQAAREFDGEVYTGRLQELLREFDAMFG
jgi:uncharacterized protein YqcC (DUF446 family)